jgi:hypothetical protein
MLSFYTLSLSGGGHVPRSVRFLTDSFPVMGWRHRHMCAKQACEYLRARVPTGPVASALRLKHLEILLACGEDVEAYLRDVTTGTVMAWSAPTAMQFLQPRVWKKRFLPRQRASVLSKL